MTTRKASTPKKTTATAAKATQKPKFAKADLLSSKEFTAVDKDFLNALLTDGETYTIEEAKKILADKLKGEIK